MPKLVYLQNLADKNQKSGIFLVFVNTRGKHDSTGIGKIVYLTYPIIEDDGTIRAQFNAYSEDTIIIDRNFKIKYKSSRFNKHNIYDEVAKWTGINVNQQKSRQRDKLFKSINNFTYYDVMNNELCRMNQANKKWWSPPVFIANTNRKFFFFFDFAFNNVAGISKSRKAALDFLDTQVQPDDLVGVLSFVVKQGLTLHEYLTSDHRRIKQVIEELGSGKFMGRAWRIESEWLKDHLKLDKSLGDNVDSTKKSWLLK